MQSSVELLERYPDRTKGIELGELVEEVKGLVSGLSGGPESQHFLYRDLTIRIWDETLTSAFQERSKELKPNIPQQSQASTRGRIYEEKMKAMQQANNFGENQN